MQLHALLRHIDEAQADAETFAAARCYALARIRARDAEALAFRLKDLAAEVTRIRHQSAPATAPYPETRR